MLVTTTERIPGQEYEVLGECFGVTTQSRDIISNFGAGLKNLVGGEIKGYTKMLTTSRQEAIDRLKEEAAAMGADAMVINPRYLTGLDTELLDQLQADHQVVVTLEDGILEGGYGQTIASYLGDSAVRVQNYGLQKAYPDRYDVNGLLAQNGLTADNIAQQALKALN